MIRLLTPLLLLAAPQAHAQAPAPADSAALHREARDAQALFERVRVHHAPRGWSRGSGPCDERVGRFCIRYSTESDDESTPPYRAPPEVPAVAEAREVFDSTLTELARAIPGDAWIAGQRVGYRAEVEEWDAALEAARDCRSPEPGWCDLLIGTALHGAARVADAEEAFDRALAALPDDKRTRWLDPEILLENDVVRELRRLDADERARLETRIWHLGNPLFLVGGNALLTEHLSRRTIARIRDNARNPHGIRWGNDLTELLVRFGPVRSWERIQESMGYMGPPPVSGRYSWNAKGIFPTWAGLLDPAGEGADAFPAAVFRARARHSPPGIPRVRGLRTQIATFPRGDSLLVVAAWEVPDPPAWDTLAPVHVSEGALFLLAGGDGPPTRHDITPGRAGTGTALVPAGDWLLAVELADPEGGRGWRHRTGLTKFYENIITSAAARRISDLLLLAPEALAPGLPEPEDAPEPEAPPGPGRVEDHLHRALPSDTISAGPVEIAWELHDLPPSVDELPIVLGLRRVDRGTLRRVGEALRILSPEGPVESHWVEGRPPTTGDPDAPLFRRLVVDFSGVSPGQYNLELRVHLPAGEDLIVHRILVIR